MRACQYAGRYWQAVITVKWHKLNIDEKREMCKGEREAEIKRALETDGMEMSGWRLRGRRRGAQARMGRAHRASKGGALVKRKFSKLWYAVSDASEFFEASGFQKLHIAKAYGQAKPYDKYHHSARRTQSWRRRIGGALRSSTRGVHRRGVLVIPFYLPAAAAPPRGATAGGAQPERYREGSQNWRGARHSMEMIPDQESTDRMALMAAWEAVG